VLEGHFRAKAEPLAIGLDAARVVRPSEPMQVLAEAAKLTLEPTPIRATYIADGA
jgi:hypothetical protein